MASTEGYHRLYVPKRLLGWGLSTWTGTRIRLILDHYEWDYREINPTKTNLMHELHLLVQEYALDREDRLDIFNARERGESPPQRKPRVQTLPHPTWSVARQKIVRNLAQGRTRSQKAPTIAATQYVRNNAVATNPLPIIARTLPRDCVVCFDTLNPQNTPERRITSFCNHVPDVCRSCLAMSISTQLNSKVWDQIDCPTCGHRLNFQDMRAFADPAAFVRYDNHSLQACLSGGHFQRCRHPNCQSGQQCFPEQDSYMVCVACRGRTCISCDIIWHPLETCASIAARRAEVQAAEETAATQYLTTNVKLCPRCNVRGEKVSGCDHMTCPQCRFQYCWICLVDFGEIRRHGNNRHRNDCRYHSDNLPAAPGLEAWVAAQGATPAPAIAAPQAAAPLLQFVETRRLMREEDEDGETEEDEEEEEEE